MGESFFDEALGGFADDAGGVSIDVAVDLAALRVRRSARYAGCRERCGVGNGDMSIDADQESGMAAADGVDVGFCRQRFRGPEGVIPSSAGEPCAGSSVFGGFLDAALHIRQRLRASEIDGKLDLSG